MTDYRIQKRADAMIWKLELRKPEKDMRILVDDGLVALAFAGGAMAGEFRAGDKKLFNEGGRLGKVYKKNSFCFYVFNRDKAAPVKWGVGKTPVPYEDRRLGGLVLNVCGYGHCDVMIHDAVRLWEKLPEEYTADGVVQPQEIEAFIQREVIARISPVLSRKLNEIGDYTRVTAAADEIGRALTYALPDLEDLGLHVDKAVVEGLDFTDESKEIIEKHRDSKVAKIESDIVREQSEQIRNILTALQAGDGKEEA